MGGHGAKIAAFEIMCVWKDGKQKMNKPVSKLYCVWST